MITASRPPALWPPALWTLTLRLAAPCLALAGCNSAPPAQETPTRSAEDQAAAARAQARADREAKLASFYGRDVASQEAPDDADRPQAGNANSAPPAAAPPPAMMAGPAALPAAMARSASAPSPGPAVGGVPMPPPGVTIPGPPLGKVE